MTDPDPCTVGGIAPCESPTAPGTRGTTKLKQKHEPNDNANKTIPNVVIGMREPPVDEGVGAGVDPGSKIIKSRPVQKIFDPGSKLALCQDQN